MESKDDEDLSKQLNKDINNLLKVIQNDSIKSEHQKDRKANENEAEENSKRVVEDTDEVVEVNNEVPKGAGDLATDAEITENTDGIETIKNEDEVKADSQEMQSAVDEKNDQLASLKNTAVRSTPTRASTRLANTPAVPSSIRTRRASRLMQNQKIPLSQNEFIGFYIRRFKRF